VFFRHKTYRLYRHNIHIVQKGYAVYFIIINNNNNFFRSYTANFLQHYSLHARVVGIYIIENVTSAAFKNTHAPPSYSGLSSVKTSRKVYNIVMSQYNILINKYYYYSNVIIPAARIHYVINGRIIDHIPITIYRYLLTFNLYRPSYIYIIYVCVYVIPL